MTYTGSGEPAVSGPYVTPGAHPGPANGPAPTYRPDPVLSYAAYPAPDPSPVPEPPRGPGVTPPFPVPPAEGRAARVWLGIGIGALVAMLACGGGIAAVIGLVTTGTRALNEQVVVVVGDYFEAVKQRNFAKAYEQLCEDARDDESAADFARRLAAEPAITHYDVGDLSVSAIEPVVSVDVVYAAGTTDTLQVTLGQNGSTGALEVCGVGR